MLFIFALKLMRMGKIFSTKIGRGLANRMRGGFAVALAAKSDSDLSIV